MATVHFTLLIILLIYFVFFINGCVYYNEFYDNGVCCTSSLSYDSVCLPAWDDYATERIKVSANFDFFGNATNNYLYVGTNGIISFNRGVTEYISRKFPQIGILVMIAPFWEDIDISQAGSICYRQITSGRELGKVREEVRTFVPAMKNFSPTWMFVVTWCDVPAFSNRLSRRNTFQSTIVTDGINTFVVYNYHKIEWSQSNSGTNAQVGFNKGDNFHYYSVEGSMTSEISHLKQKSNVNQPGKLIFKVDLPKIEDHPETIECRFTKTDLIFLIDSSVSEERHFQKILNIIVHFVSITGIGRLKVGVVSFSQDSNREFSLNTYDNASEIVERVKNIRHLNGTTNMESGLETAKRMFTFYEGARSGSKRYIVILSDGLVTNKAKTEQEVQNIREANIRVICVGVGMSVSHAFLEKLSYNYSYLINPNPETLLSLIQYEIRDPNCMGCNKTHASDILFMIDTSSSVTYRIFHQVIEIFVISVAEALSSEIPHSDQIQVSVGAISDKSAYVLTRSNLSSLIWVINDNLRTKQPANYSKAMEFAYHHVQESQHEIHDVHEQSMVIFIVSCFSGSNEKDKKVLDELRNTNATVYMIAAGCDDASWTDAEQFFQDGYHVFDIADFDLFTRRRLTDIQRINCSTL